jgi:hypothetical protein
MKAKGKLNLKIKTMPRVYLDIPVTSIRQAKHFRRILSPPDGPIAYSNFKLYRDGEPIEF